MAVAEAIPDIAEPARRPDDRQAVGRARPSLLACAGGVLAGWVVLESMSAAEFRLSGPHIRQHDVPFESLNSMLAPPGRLRVPSDEERAAIRERLEADEYRVVVQQDPKQFPALIEPHLAAFWDLRLVEGYSTGLPRRLGLLPWNETIVTAHHRRRTHPRCACWRRRRRTACASRSSTPSSPTRCSSTCIASRVTRSPA